MTSRLRLLREIGLADLADPSLSERLAGKALAAQLEKVNPDAAAGLRQGLGETLIVTHLGMNGRAVEDGGVDQPGGVDD